MNRIAAARPSFYWGWGLIPLLFAAAAWSQLTRYGLWHDELYTLGFLRGIDAYLLPTSDLAASEQHPLAWYQQLLRQDTFWPHFWRDVSHEGHPPLYYLLLKGWTLLWGTGERGLRSFSLLAATLTLVVAARVGSLLSRRAAVLLPLLLASCPPFLLFALEARMYALYLLLAALTGYWLLRLLRQPVAGGAALGWFVGTGLALVSTHYYGVFWYGTLAVVPAGRLLRQRAWGRLLALALPGLALGLWLPVIRAQAAAHPAHWTNGHLGLLASVVQYGRGGAALLTTQTTAGPELLALGLLGLALLLTQRQPLGWPVRRWVGPALLAALYGAGIIGLDFLLNHHTIAVPRYFAPLLLALLLAVVALGEQARSRLVQGLVVSGLLLVFGRVHWQQLSAGREAKQSLREVAHYLTRRYPANSVELVFAPGGPAALGVAYYCPVSYPARAEPARQVCAEYTKRRVVVVAEHLGAPTEAWAQACPVPLAAGRCVRFVAVEVVNAR